jgi:hypothetical protein
MVVGHGLRLVAIGLAVGVVSAYGAAGAVGSLLYRTESRDLLTFSVVPILLVAIALIAYAVPAYRASYRCSPCVPNKTPDPADLLL